MTDPRPLLVGREWTPSPTTVPVVNPYNGATVAQVCQASRAHANAAMDAARRAFAETRRLPAHARASALVAIAQALTRRKEEFATTITAEAGKPITDARREVDRAVQTFTVASEEAKRIGGDIIPLDLTPGMESYLGMSRHVALGPILGITPFNFPLNLVAHKVAPALAAGNPIVIKPAPQTPLTALLLGEIIRDTDWPDGAFSVLPCDNAVAESMVTDERFKLLSFTGSAAVGWMLKGKCGKKRVVLELGGNAGVIVEPDADLEVAVARCVAGGYGYSGQTCISVQHVYVHEAVYPTFLDMVASRVRELKAGDPQDPATVIGPVIDQRAACRIEEWVQDAVAAGAALHTGGKRTGTLVDATLLTDVGPTLKVSCEEVFGPVLNITPYRRFEEAIRSLNQSTYGLQAGVFTQDIGKVFEAYRDLEVGAVLANEIPTFRADHMPYGGVKDSGLGREGVRYAIEEMTEIKLLVLNLPGIAP